MGSKFGWRRRLRRPSLHARVMACVCLACLLIVGLDVWRTWQARSLAIAADMVETANLARSLAEHAHGMIQIADTALVDLRERAETDGMGADHAGRLRALMRARIETFPEIHGLFAYDSAGNSMATGISGPPGVTNYSDRSYFQFHRAHADRGIHIGEVVRSRTDGSWIITASRRVDGANGAFAGIVVATISIQELHDFYATFDIGPHGAIALMTEEGRIVARVPSTKATIGADLSRSPLFRNYLPRALVGGFRYVSELDGVTRIGSYRPIDDYGLVIIVSHGLADVLAPWWSDARLHLSVSLCVAAALAFGGNRLGRQIQRRHRIERQFRLLADHSSDAIICSDLKGRRLYVSPAFETLTGWSAAESIGQHRDEFVHPDDRARLAATLEERYAGRGSGSSCFRYICKDGSALWVEARAQLVPAMDGEPAQIVSNIRDITERRQAEDRVAELNRELAAQASTDGLTGLANRRRFDSAVAQEWRRTERQHMPLSLLMIDVDHFKLYNDRFGHQEGDHCLREVAGATLHWARRPGDLAARYGGEEIVVLLPDTEAHGAAECAEGVRTAIQALGLCHPGNAPHDVVTVSIGVATLSPRLDDAATTPEILIALADAALYEAKRLGRNRVVTEAALSQVPPAPQRATEHAAA